MPRERKRKRRDAPTTDVIMDDHSDNKDDRHEYKEEKRTSRYSYRVDHAHAKAELQKAKASKWKWLFFLIGLIAAIAGFFKLKLPFTGG